ncbi:hypothetical protein ACIQ7D_20005 [Streptomyces sp. NPDC096310]|uniref:hypothetical protein n=1 Tax=Streptomyces sp. NPDC096310 TaxID=3366082 RepID=UPI003830B09E
MIVKLLPGMHASDGGPAATADEFLVGELTAQRARIERVIEDLRRSRSLLNTIINTAAAQRRDQPRQTPQA